MAKKQFNTRLGEDLARPVENYAETNDAHTSDGVRHFVRMGVEAERQAATDGGTVKQRLSFLDLMVIVVSLSTVMTWILAFAAGEVYVKWAWSLSIASVVLLAVYFGQVVYDTTQNRAEGAAR